MSEAWGLDGPYFDDLAVGHRFLPGPGITIDAGMVAMYQAIVGDPLAIALARPLAERVTKGDGGVVNPALVLHVAIGQSTVATRRVIANLFYKGVRSLRAVRVGSTLQTSVVVRAMRETSRRDDRPRRGMVLLGMRTIDENANVVADFERCALLPFRDTTAHTHHADDIAGPRTDITLDDWLDVVPANWDLSPFAATPPWAIDEARADPLRDTVTDAPALVRLTQNLAAAHRDTRLGQHGRRLVYGGHTIGLAQASLVRLVPSTATVLGWQYCDHTAPVFEEDLLDVTATLVAEQSAPGGRLRALRVIVHAERPGADGAPTRAPVLDWMPIVYCA
jgi:2-methylfumaryl-CoA hydratase